LARVRREKTSPASRDGSGQVSRASTAGDVLVFVSDRSRMHDYGKLAAKLRQRGTRSVPLKEKVDGANLPRPAPPTLTDCTTRSNRGLGQATVTPSARMARKRHSPGAFAPVGVSAPRRDHLRGSDAVPPSSAAKPLLSCCNTSLSMDELQPAESVIPVASSACIKIGWPSTHASQ
jgi:hypothetical protein